MADVFISYDKRDAEIATALARHLELSGFVVWWDTQLVGGETFRDAIEKQLSAARAVIVIWTDHSIQSKWVISEADHASKNGKLIPLRASSFSPQSIPMPFSQWQTEPIENRDAVISALKRLGVEPRYAQAAGGSLHDRFWKEIESSEHPEDFELYLKEFPEGPQVSYVKLKLARLARVARATPGQDTIRPSQTRPAGAAPTAGRWSRWIAVIFWGFALAGLGGAGFWQMQQITAQLNHVQAEVDRPRMADDADWEKSDGLSLIRDWQGYLARRPVGLHAGEAEARIEKRLNDGRMIAKLEGHDASILSLQAEPDGAHMTTGDENGQVVVWNLATRSIDRRSRGEKLKKPVSASSSSFSISYQDTDGVSVHNHIIRTRGSVLMIDNEGSVPINSYIGSGALLCFSAEVSSVLYNDSIYIVDRLTKKGARLDTEKVSGEIASCAQSPGLIVVSVERTIYAVARPNLKLLATLDGHVAPVRAVAVSPFGTSIISAGDDRTVRLWDISDLVAASKP